MYCSKCGNQNEIDAKFCTSCGAPLQISMSNIQESPTNSNMNAVYENPLIYQTNVVQTPLPNGSEPKKNIKTTISLILGIISVLLSYIFSIFILPISIIGLVLGLKDRTNSKKRMVGIILNIIGIIIAIVTFFLIMLDIANENQDNSSNKIYYGDGFEINYGSDWSKTTLSGGQEALEYQHQAVYLVPVGNSSLSNATNELDCDFEDYSCQNKIYEEFYNYWDSDAEGSGRHLYGGSNSFSILKDDIYYATMDYGISSDKLRGKMYLLISEENNVILSFMSNYTNSTLYDPIVLNLLNNITINVKYDNDLSDLLDAMSNWNRYSNLQTSQLAKKATIDGGWRTLSDSETYWVFEDGEFYWYKSVNDLNDNYWYGTTKIVKGKEGLQLAGLDENRMDTIFAQSKGKVTSDDIYAIVCTPSKIISGGVDKSSTNINADTKWTLVWIIIDHGTEGIEGQMINMNTYDVGYYVKIKD